MNQLLWNLYFKGMNLFNGIMFAGENSGDPNGTTPDLGAAKSMIEGLADVLIGYVVPIATVCLILDGIWYMVAGKKSSEEARGWMKRIALGVLICYAAGAIASWLQRMGSSI